MENVLVEVV